VTDRPAPPRGPAPGSLPVLPGQVLPGQVLPGRDEAFWKAQEKRRGKQLGQPCCTQSGMSWSMIDVPGNFAVVVHGEYDCLNCFHHHTGRSAHQYYSTRLTEEMLTTGRTEAQLRRCLELIAEHQRPEVVLVLGTCPVEVIGDRFGPVVQDVSARTGIPMVPLRTSGLALSTQEAMLDWLFETLARLPPGPPVDRRLRTETAELALELLFDTGLDPHALAGRAAALAAARGTAGPRVNLVGLPAGPAGAPEPLAVLAAAGIEVNGTYPDGASIAEWRAIRHAAHGFVVDRTVYPRLVRALGEHGQPIVEVPLPVGLDQTRRFYRAIGEATGRLAELEAACSPHAASAEEAVESFRDRHRGLRAAVAIRMMNSYRSDVLAYDGLGEVAALEELGFEVELLIQGPPEEDARERMRERLAARGSAHSFRAFPGPYALGQMLTEGGYDLCVIADSSREAAHAAAVPMLSTRSLGAFFGAVPDNVDRIERALAERRAPGHA